MSFPGLIGSSFESKHIIISYVLKNNIITCFFNGNGRGFCEKERSSFKRYFKNSYFLAEEEKRSGKKHLKIFVEEKLKFPFNREISILSINSYPIDDNLY